MLSSRHVACALLMFVSATATRAQTIVSWANIGTDFASGANWQGGMAPTSADVARFDSATPVAQPTLAAAGAAVAGLVFGNTAGSFTLAGPGTLTIGASGIANQSVGVPQTIAVPLVVGTTTATIDNRATLALTGPITNTTTAGLVLTGPGHNGSIVGIISGPGGITKHGAGTWVLSTTNAYTGGTIVNAGTLRLGAVDALGTGSLTLNAQPVTGPGGVLQHLPAIVDLDGRSQTVSALAFGGNAPSQVAGSRLVLGYAGVLNLAGNVTYNAAGNPMGATIAARLPDDSSPFGGTLSLGATTREFNIADSTNAVHELTIFSTIAGQAGAGLTKTGAGALTLGGQNTYDGNTMVSAGTLYVGSNSVTSGSTILSGPVGRGSLILQTGATLAPTVLPTPYAFNHDITLANPVSLQTGVTLGAAPPGSDQWLTLSGLVTALASSTTIHLGGNDPVFFEGGLSATTAGTAITFDSAGRVDAAGRTVRGIAILAGNISAHVASITAHHAAIIFGSPGAIPAPGATVQAVNGYLGVAALNSSAVPSPSELLARIADRAGFSGTFGFDNDGGSWSAPHDFSGSIDLTGFGTNLTLGSLTSAVLSGTITPPASTGYQFGNGGGTLVVRSSLVDTGGPKAVSVSSSPDLPHNALTVVLQGSNSFTGGLSVAHSVAILDAPQALPAGGTFSLGANGYLGYTAVAAGSFGGFLSGLSSYTSTSVLGFDSSMYLPFSSGGRVVTETVDLTLLGPIYIGTATYAQITGAVLAPNASGADRTLSLLGAKGGHLVVGSSLGGDRVKRVVVGSQAALADGVVELSGRNTHAGGTTLNSGVLRVGGSSTVSPTGTILSGPLGTGMLTVDGAAQRPTLAASNSLLDTVLHNAIQLGSALRIGLGAFYDGVVMPSEYAYGYGHLVLAGVISDLPGAAGDRRLDIHANTVLHGANTFSGGVNLFSGTLTIGHDSALGTGLLAIDGGSWYSGLPRLQVAGGSRTITNPVAVNLFEHDWLQIGGTGSLTFAGPVTLNSNVVFDAMRHPVFFTGGIGGTGRLLTEGAGALVISGTNTYQGGTHAYHGAIVFASAASIPGTGLLSAFEGGYIGVASPAFATTLQAGFLDRFNKPAMYGTIGFDTLSGGTHVFAGNIDLGGFASSARLGSSTSAILSGTISPQPGGAYPFGGGGGLLEVRSNLVDSADGPPGSLVVWSPAAAPLTLRLGGTNTYTGGTDVWSSAVIFKAGALPPASAFEQFFVSHGYLGTEDTTLPLADYLARFATSTDRMIIGFDSFSAAPYHVGGELSLTRFGSGAIVYLGTATRATLSGAITLPAGQNAYRFTGYKGGRLTVATTLENSATGSRSVVLGDAAVEATFGNPANPAEPRSGVTLSGANTYSGGTTLSAGVLHLGSSSVPGTSGVVSGPIGTGVLTVAAHPLESFRLGLFPAAGTTQSLANPITLQGSLEVGGGLTLSGAITGIGGLFKADPGTLTLSGSNSFSGGVMIEEGSVTFASAAAVGSGALGLRGPDGDLASFLESSTVNGIRGGSSLHRIAVAGGNTLTINQTEGAHYAGKFESTNGGSIGLVFTGPAMGPPTPLRLTGDSTFAGFVAIQSGAAVLAGSSSAFGAPANPVTLDGGRLVVEANTTVSNPLTLNSGVLAGFGVLQTAHPLPIRSGVVLAPGDRDTPGTLFFTGVTALSLESGGTYLWKFSDAANPDGGWDHVKVFGGVAIDAQIMPFTFKIMPGGPLELLGSVANFDPYQMQSWSVLAAFSIDVTGSLASAFTIDSSAMAAQIAGGTFSFSIGNTSDASHLMLNFTPVPEPSTYALLGLGTVAVILVLRRRARR
jgi:autotransporter-associated beta strand protein